MNNTIMDRLKGDHRKAADPQELPTEQTSIKKKRRSKSAEEKLNALKEKQKKLAAQVKAEEAKIKKHSRRQDTRRKIVAGAIALEHMEHDENFKHVMEGLLKRHVKESDQRLFDFSSSDS